jgi:hypothetical protein
VVNWGGVVLGGVSGLSENEEVLIMILRQILSGKVGYDHAYSNQN